MKRSTRIWGLTLIMSATASLVLPFSLFGATTSVSVASINLCTDQLAVLLADPDQILSLSNLSLDPSGSYYFNEVDRYHKNRGHAEEILPLKPDVILAGAYTAKNTLKQLQNIGLIVEVIPVAHSIDDMLGNIRRVANLLSKPARGQVITAMLEKRLSALKTNGVARPLAAVYDPNGYTVGVNTLRGQILELAGWHNAATEVGIDGYGSLPLEALVRLKPAAMIESPYSEGTYSRAQALTDHPAIRQAGLNPVVISVPSRETICAGPWTVDIIERLSRERTRITGN